MPHLEIILVGGRKVRLEAPANGDVEKELLDFLQKRGLYNGENDQWVRIAEGEFVRYDQIVAVKRVVV